MHYLLIAFSLAVTPLCGATPTQSNNNVKITPREISGDVLKSWYDQNKSMVVIDARSKPRFDGTLLPQAKWLPVDSATDNEIQAAIPSKDSLVVVYCGGYRCPASNLLYDRLVGMGYTNIYEYHGGIEEWSQKGYPTIKSFLK